MKDKFDFNSKTFNNFMNPFVNGLKNFTSSMINQAKWMHFMNRPIGIVSKNKNFIAGTIKRQIGKNEPKYDGFGNSIGFLESITDIKYGKIPWYKSDNDKINTSNYIEYLKNINVKIDNKFTQNIIRYNNNNINRNINKEISVIRGLNFDRNDTRIGILGEHFLTQMLNDSSNVNIDSSNEKSKHITTKAYANFGLKGSKGIYSVIGPKSKSVSSNEELIGSIIDDEGLFSSTNGLSNDFSIKSSLGIDLFSNSIEPISKYYNNSSKNNIYINLIGKIKPIKHNNSVIRRELLDVGNLNLTSRDLFTYAEPDGNGAKNDTIANGNYNNGVAFGNYKIYNDSTLTNKNDIINYTNNLFQEGEIKTLIGRFHTNELNDNDITATSISKKYGMSHGRNLLKIKQTDENGYNNPFCRVWTFHHQYSKLSDTIRPFYGTDGNLKNSEVSKYRTDESFDKLSKYGVKGTNKLVQIAPTNEDNIRNCMFSIENLAWKDEKLAFDIHGEKKGPLGGRIMWFPPYDLKFSENVNVNWNANQFIGRGESIYTYTNTERSGQLSFKLLIDHPSVINSFRGEKSKESSGNVDDINSDEQTLLRFFAGCSILEPQASKKKKTVNNKPIKEKHAETPTVTFNEINFYVFFPNNYSGIDDSPTSEIPPMEYLVNGIGTNIIEGNENYSINEKVNGIGYEMTSRGISEIVNKEFLGSYIKESNAKPNSTISKKEDFKYSVTDNSNNTFIVQKGRNDKLWGYRVDKRVDNEILRNKNYTDNISYQLNSINYEKLVQVHTDAKKIKDNGTLYSFIDFFLALEPQYCNKLSNSSRRYKEIKSLLNEYKINSVNITGFASSHGHTNSNNTLAKNRAISIERWMKKCNSNKFSKCDFNNETAIIGQKLDNQDVNSFLAKVWRCVKVTIKLEKESLSNKIDNQIYSTDKDGNILDENSVLHNEKDEEKNIANLNVKYISDKYTEEESSNNKTYTDSISEKEKELNKENDEIISETIIKGNQSESMGYVDEFEFFEELQHNDPLLHNKLVEKIKYFDPAFHSITPEGFQSRLTFLHQCTRQGSTSSSSDSNARLRTADNLAFGRPPVCVLRIGDFYNTKIIIDSLSINYDDTTWDLNDEGIGVMPMIADVNISFKFLGGSDLSGPISRLQNALSFNHYGNTSLYDNRSEEIEYDENGNIIKFKPMN